MDESDQGEKIIVNCSWEVDSTNNGYDEIKRSPFYYHNDSIYHYRWQFKLKLQSDSRSDSIIVRHELLINFDSIQNNYTIESIQDFRLRKIQRATFYQYQAHTDIDIDKNKINESAGSIDSKYLTVEMKNSTFTFTLRFNATFDLRTNFISDSDRNWVGPKVNLSKDLEKLFNNKDSHDIKFVIGEQDLYAFKNILSARSKYFEAMFRNDSIETRTNEIKIEDVDFEVFREFIRFLYTGSVENLDNASSLLVLANKYGQSELLNICDDLLCEKLSLENASEMLKLAATHNASKLLKMSASVVCKKSSELLKLLQSKQRKNLSEEDFYRMAETLQWLTDLDKNEGNE